MRSSVRQVRRNAVVGAVAVALVGSACHISAARAQDGDAPITKEELQQALEELNQALRERDAIISELLQRVVLLERERAAEAKGRTYPVPLAPLAEPAAPAAPDVASAAPEAGPEEQPAAPGGAGAPPATGAPPPPAAGDQTAQADRGGAPGQLFVDDIATERALERTLVREGALLLPFGQAELEPSFSYTRRVVDFPTFFDDGATTIIGQEESRRNEFLGELGLRVGLPFDSQFEITMPYSVVNASVVDKVGGSERDEDENTGSGIGDLAVGFAKTLLTERGWRPDVVARVVWDTDTGDTTDNGVVLGGGFHELSGEISVTKRQDPLAFVGAAAYTNAFEKNDIEPGNELAFSLGAVLAASPRTSLRLVLNQQFIDNLKVDGEGINGSDLVVSTLGIGASSILGDGLFLDGQLTDDSPDYAIRLSLPFRFNTPGL